MHRHIERHNNTERADRQRQIQRLREIEREIGYDMHSEVVNGSIVAN